MNIKQIVFIESAYVYQYFANIKKYFLKIVAVLYVCLPFLSGAERVNIRTG